jgi:DNA-binding IclR family transcriptional regulator
MRRSPQRQAILDVIREAPEPIGPMDIVATLTVPVGSVRHLLAKLVKEGAIIRVAYGQYAPNPTLPPPGPWGSGKV